MVRREKSHEWLDKLGRESWHLELLISGFSIFLLIQGLDMAEFELRLFFNRLQLTDIFVWNALQSYVWFLLIGGKGVLYSLIIHLFLRGIWIAAVGLRTVNKQTNLSAQGFTPFFQRVLKRNVLPLDAYIIQLDKICSNIFAFGYLVLFVALCIGIYFGLILGMVSLVFEVSGSMLPSGNGFVITLFNGLLYIISLFYFLDFAFLGAIKRVDGLDKFYYPFYKFLSWISLSFIYRTLYYTMLGNRISRRFLWFIVPFYIIIYLGDSISFQTQPLIPKSSNTLSIIPGYYDDLNPDYTIKLASTPSRYVSNNVLEVFIPIKLDYVLTNKIKRHCPDNPPVHSSAISSFFELYHVDQSTIQSEDKVRPYLDCMNKLYDIQIDHQVLQSLPFFYQHPKTFQYGLLHMIEIDSLSRGVHHVEVGRIDSKKVADQDSIYYRPYALFPIWKI